MKTKMNKLLLTILALSLTVFSSGCAKRVVAPVPGQLNTFDAYSFRVLADTQAAINAFKADVQSGKVTETPTIKTTLNMAITDYNAADAAYQAWHAIGGTGSTTALAAQISKLTVDVAAISGGVK